MSPAKCEDPLLAILLHQPRRSSQRLRRMEACFCMVGTCWNQFFLPWYFSLILLIKIQMAMAGWLHHDVIAWSNPAQNMYLKKLQFLWQVVEPPWSWCVCSLFDYITSHSVTFWKAKIMMPCVTTVATSCTRCNHQGFDRAFGDWVQGAFWLPCSVTFFNGGFWPWPLGRAVRMT